MFNILLDYPSYESEVEIVKNTTQDVQQQVSHVLSGEEIMQYQQLVRKVPVADNVVEYAVGLVQKTRPNYSESNVLANTYLEWGAGPRASQYLVLAAKCNALIEGKYSPDIEDVKAIAVPCLRHRVVRNFKAEAEGMSIEHIIGELMQG